MNPIIGVFDKVSGNMKKTFNKENKGTGDYVLCSIYLIGSFLVLLAMAYTHTLAWTAMSFAILFFIDRTLDRFFPRKQ